MKTYTFRPSDLLFFRDGRPIDAVGGYGARWPDAPLIFDALHAALHRAFPMPQEWEHHHRTGHSSTRDYDAERNQRFGGLATAGIFPVFGNQWLFPAPADWRISENSSGALRPTQVPSGARSNLPPPLCYPLLSPVEPSKKQPHPWWTRAAWEAYLRGETPAANGQFENETLFSSEWHTGIGIDPATGTQDGERIYSAQYLRLREEVHCGFFAALPTKQQDTTVRDCLAELIDGEARIIIGGQQRLCTVESDATEPATLLPQTPPITGRLVKWVLFTPVLFPRIGEHPGGWLPSWICRSTGKVKLLDGPGKNKAQRTKVNEGQPIQAKLVAACVPKPIALSGWSERLDATKDAGATDNTGPRATQLAVPAGAVYYFEADDEAHAQKLAAALSWNSSPCFTRRSTLLGEKGLGLGVCGGWEYYP